MAPYIQPSPDSYDGGASTATTAVAIDKDKNSQFALKWAIDHLPLKNNTVLLIHVKDLYNNQSDGSSNGSRGSYESPKQDQQLFLPFLGFCARKGVSGKEVVLDDTDIPKAIAEYVDINCINNIVLGAPHRNALTRNFIRRPDVASTFTKLAPDFCAVYVVSKLKATTVRTPSRPAPMTMSLPRSLPRSPMDSPASSDHSDHDDSFKTMYNNVTTTIIISPRKSHKQSTGSKLLGSSRFLDCGICRSRIKFTRGPSKRTGKGPPTSSERRALPLGRKRDQTKAPKKGGGRESPHKHFPYMLDNFDRSIHTPRSARLQDHLPHSDDLSNYGESPRLFDETSELSSSPEDNSSSFQSTRDMEEEMMRLKRELQHTMDMYSTACKEAISAKEQTERLQHWKMEEAYRFEQARLGQETALAIAKREHEKCKAAIEAAEMSKKLAEMEVKKRMEAEMKAQRDAEEKANFMTSLVMNDVRYRKYTIEEIETATDNFCDSSKIGEGGYGPVYRTTMDHTPVAIKVLKSDAEEGMQQFQQEVEVLSSIRHPNMVLLLGACPESGCLVYEYMDNGSLEDRLFRRGDTPTIPWNIRFKIAAEIATALLFLHQTKPEPLVHRDLKPGNILLDRNYTSKISDVGLARLVPPSIADTVTQYRMTSAAGTFCYIDPEYQQTGMLGIKSDVYSLGIMLLQIITAKSPMGLTHYVERSIEKGTFEQMLDPTVTDWPVEEALSFAKLALKCAELRKKDRPDLDTVVLPELNRLREFGMKEPNTDSFYTCPPWSYVASSRPRSSISSQGTTKSFCGMGTIYRSSVEERTRSGPRSVAEADRFMNRRATTVNKAW